jgi:DNA-binding MarR family transcriptional regulator
MNPANSQGIEIPPPELWPDPQPAGEDGQALTELIMTLFRLHGQVLEAAQTLAAHGGLTAAWWQVIGGVLDQPRTVAEVARRMGMTRQGVQRIADILVQRGLAEYRPNVAHRRAKLLACTQAGYWAVRQIALVQNPWSARIGAQVGAEDLRAAREVMHALAETLARDTQTTEASPHRTPA